jgi:hypothetical protein
VDTLAAAMLSSLSFEFAGVLRALSSSLPENTLLNNAGGVYSITKGEDHGFCNSVRLVGMH